MVWWSGTYYFLSLNDMQIQWRPEADAKGNRAPWCHIVQWWLLTLVPWSRATTMGGPAAPRIKQLNLSHIDGLVQDCIISSASAMVVLQSCTETSTRAYVHTHTYMVFGKWFLFNKHRYEVFISIEFICWLKIVTITITVTVTVTVIITITITVVIIIIISSSSSSISIVIFIIIIDIIIIIIIIIAIIIIIRTPLCHI